MVPDQRPSVETKQLSRFFDTGQMKVSALTAVDITLTQGEYIAVMGPSGSGKSTLLNILGLLDRPSEGAYLLDGIDTGGLSDSERCLLRSRRIGFVFQSFHLLGHIDVSANVQLGLLYNATPRHLREQMALAALEQVGLSHRSSFSPRELSGGERQRAAIARAVVASPALLLCDEPTGNLDTNSGNTILDLFDDLRRATQVTVVVVTHDENVARRADRIVRLRDGALVPSP